MDPTPFYKIISSVYRADEYPALRHQIETWRRERPLEGLQVLDATPVYRNTLTKYIALLEAGAELTVGISDVMSRDEKVVDMLRAAGVPVVKAETCGQPAFDLILDCAASFSALTPRLGYVELTRSGVEAYRRNPVRPVFVADSGRIKRIETVLGTGESYFRAMETLGYKIRKGQKLIVFGSGKVGTGIILYGIGLGADVSVVTDPFTVSVPVRRCGCRIIDMHDEETVATAVETANAVVTATGVRAAAVEHCPAQTLTKSHAVLANMGVEDEYGTDIPPERVLNGKVPLNFILEEPTHLRYIDATLALHNAGAAYIVENAPAPGLVDPPAGLEEALLAVTRRNGRIANELQKIE